MRKHTKAESGKIGGDQSSLISTAKRLAREAEYLKYPKLCLHCKEPMPYDSRNNKFCDRSCAASYNNSLKPDLVTWACAGCGKMHSTLPYKVKKYCGHSCQHVAIKMDTRASVLAGIVSDRAHIKRILIEEFGNKCSGCRLFTWMDNPLPLEVDHIDGNAGNNEFSNLRLLCPNCHSITPTWKGRNKGNGRSSRGLPLH